MTIADSLPAGEVVRRLKTDSVANSFRLEVLPHGTGAVTYYGAGRVFPLRRDGTRRGRGAIAYFGDRHTDPQAALRSALAALRTAESPHPTPRPEEAQR